MATIDDVMEKLGEVETKIGEVETKVGDLETTLKSGLSVQTICNHCGGDGNKMSEDGQSGSCPDCVNDGLNPYARITERGSE